MADLQTLVNRSEVGTIRPWTKTAAPAGFLLCDGSAVSRTTYADLFAVTSTTYGAGNGSSTFNVPNLAGKLPQGYDGSTYNLAGASGAATVNHTVTDNKSLANNQTVTITGNVGTTSLTTAQLSSHAHHVKRWIKNPQGPTQPGPLISFANCKKHTQSGFSNFGNFYGMDNTGSGTAHNHGSNLGGTLGGTVALSGNIAVAASSTLSPYVVVNYIIKY